ncbi:cysteine--tRNA ligase [Roseibaca sp. V10]|uniref:Cysteine--tRNA ligase n=1 Tax=Roseinatronobacter domitianus TaxID=2940293 RepID=A0ABT0M3A7_9RHOB|nr:cysteine--tRNA ligase [Roseibaca domitiana]MCL1629326.1 cysteine--tRNA ligase [Roseibaca domitiana]
MTEITLHNTRTRRKEAFTPLDPDNVRMYVCGPTVYDRAHLGNARPVVVFDVLYRLLRHVYGADHVTYVRNFTDVDDKINARARDMQAKGGGDLNAIIRTLTDETIDWYHADMDALGALRPNMEPRATEYIGQMVGMIEGLVAKGHAYAAEGHVLFDVRSYPDYGRLSGRSVDDMIAGARVEVAPYKRDPLDFVLWKPSAADEPGWDGPVWEGKSIGRGRPGWHIECSAMADELLGASFDIHGGGIDLQFPHHENEIAQSCCAHPDGGFARYWLHNEMVQVEGKKMSKSLGNFFTVRDLLEQGWPGEVIRFVMLSTHYRKPMDWTEEKAREAERVLRKWYKQADRALDNAEPYVAVVQALSDDLNTSAAIYELHQLSQADDAPTLRASLRFLRLMNDSTPNWAHAPSVDLSNLTSKLATLRDDALTKKDFSQVDTMKSALLNAGVEVRMSKAGVELVPGPDFDPSKLEGLE